METPMAEGRDCEVVALGAAQVRRTYRDGRSAASEAETIRAVHALGYPVPRVDAWDGPSIVMERVAGPTLGEELLGGRLPADHAATTLTGLMDRLHALPWPGGEPLLHLDLHPFNVLLGPAGPVVIDWSNARPGPAGLDRAMTAVILASAAVEPDGPGRDAVEPFLRAYAAASGPYLEHLEAAAAERVAGPLTRDSERATMAEALALARSVL